MTPPQPEAYDPSKNPENQAQEVDEPGPDHLCNPADHPNRQERADRRNGSGGKNSP